MIDVESLFINDVVPDKIISGLLNENSYLASSFFLLA